MNAVERQIVSALLDRAAACAWPLAAVFDGEALFTADPKVSDAANRQGVFALLDDLDEAYVYFKNPHADGRAWVRLVFGNSADCLVDYSLVTGFEELLKPVNDLADTLDC